MFTPSPNQGFSPELIGNGVPPEFSSTPVPPETRYSLFELMEREVDSQKVSQDQADWLLKIAYGDIHEAQLLMNRFRRPGGFMGQNFNIGG